MRIAILGCGSIGQRLTGCLRDLGQSDLVAYDPALASRSAMREQFALFCCDTLAAVWALRPSVAFVTSSAPWHVPLAHEAVARGCDVFIEKPLSDSADGVAELLAESRKRGAITMVACNMRFHTGPATVKRLLNEGAVGRVLAGRLFTGSYLPSWRPGTDYRGGVSANAASGGGAILECIHEIDLALWYFGPAALRASASLPAASIGLEVEGLAELLLEHDSGVLSSVHLNFIQRDYRRGCEIVGEEGTLRWNFGEPLVTIAGSEGVRHATVPAFEINDMYRSELRHFLAAVESRELPSGGLDEGWAALRIALEAKGAGPRSWPDSLVQAR